MMKSFTSQTPVVALMAIAVMLAFLIPKASQAQEITVRGTVLYYPEMGDCLRDVPCSDEAEHIPDEKWVPTPGAVNILVKGTDIVTKTDREGRYEITVPSPDATLEFLYLAHSRLEIPVEGRRVLDVKLTPTSLPAIDRLFGLIIPDIVEGIYPSLDELAEKANVNRATAREIMWLVLGNQTMRREYPGEYIPNYEFQ